VCANALLTTAAGILFGKGFAVGVLVLGLALLALMLASTEAAQRQVPALGRLPWIADHGYRGSKEPRHIAKARAGPPTSRQAAPQAPVKRPPFARTVPPDPSARPGSLKGDLEQALAEGQLLRRGIPQRLNPQATLAYIALGAAKTTGEDVARWRANVETLLDKDDRRRATFLYDPPSGASLADKTLHGMFISPLAQEMDQRLSQLEKVIRTL